MSNKNTELRQPKTQNSMKNQQLHNKNHNKVVAPVEEQPKFNYFIIPIFIILGIIPLMLRYIQYNPDMAKFAWFPASDKETDIFLIVKLKWHIFISVIMAIAVVIKLVYKRKSIQFSKIWIPLIAYAVLAFLSAVLSEYSSYCFSGSYEMFESIYAILGYCLIVYYVFLFVEKEQDFIKIQYFLTGIAIVLGLLGTFQFLGYDLFATQLGKNIMVPSNLRDYVNLDIVFGAKRVYLTLFNPNYVGVYVALITPIMVVMMLFQKKLVLRIIMAIAALELIICAIGSQSLAGILGLGSAAIAIIIFMWRYLLKRIHIAIAVVILCVIGLVSINILTHQSFTNKLLASLNMQKTFHALTDMRTDNDGVTLTYNGNKLRIYSNINDDGVLTMAASDANNQEVVSSVDTTTNIYTITDDRFAGIQYGWDSQNPELFNIVVEGYSYRFTNLTGDGCYYYVNAFGKPDKMITAPSAVFTGYESFASGRGYIWSRTLPMLKNYVILGSGPDTYTMVFPQQDYMNMQRIGMSGSILTKPHSMYLQIAVQTGLLSLLAFLLFYGIYFVTSIRLYIKGRFTSFYAKMGVAVFIGTFAYMITGLTNDSSICTAPTFWTLLGVGIALNHKAEPLIHKEVQAIKAAQETQEVPEVDEDITKKSRKQK